MDCYLTLLQLYTWIAQDIFGWEHIEGLMKLFLRQDKYSAMVNKDQIHQLLKNIMATCSINDIAIEEEDIGNVVERIYNSATEIGNL